MEVKYEETRQTTERTGSALNCHHGGGNDAGGRYDKGIGGRIAAGENYNLTRDTYSVYISWKLRL